MSHWLAGVVGYRNRFAWDAGVRKEIFEFGKWITGSSAVDFEGQHIDIAHVKTAQALIDLAEAIEAGS